MKLLWMIFIGVTVIYTNTDTFINIKKKTTTITIKNTTRITRVRKGHKTVNEKIIKTVKKYRRSKMPTKKKIKISDKPSIEKYLRDINNAGD